MAAALGNGARLKTFQVRYLPENSVSRSIVPASGSGVGFVTKYNPEWEAVIDADTFAREIKEVDCSHQINHICYKVYNDKKAEATKSIPSIIHNQLRVALCMIALALFSLLTFSYFDRYYETESWQSAALYGTCGLALVGLAD